jgi:hypothetical protein
MKAFPLVVVADALLLAGGVSSPANADIVARRTGHR